MLHTFQLSVDRNSVLSMVKNVCERRSCFNIELFLQTDEVRDDDTRFYHLWLLKDIDPLLQGASSAYSNNKLHQHT